MQGAGPGGRQESSVCVKETLGLSYADGSTGTRRAEWCLERSYKESSVYLQFIFLMGMGSNAGGNRHEGCDTCPARLSPLCYECRRYGGVWVAGQGYAELPSLHLSPRHP